MYELQVNEIRNVAGGCNCKCTCGGSSKVIDNSKIIEIGEVANNSDACYDACAAKYTCEPSGGRPSITGDCAGQTPDWVFPVVTVSAIVTILCLLR